MQKELAHILKGKLLTLPFIDLVAGLVQTLTLQDQSEDNLQIIEKRVPVSYDTWNGSDCVGKEILLIPDSSRKSIIYFEDNGIEVGERRARIQGFISSLRLVCWLDKSKIVGDQYTPELAGRVQTAIISRLCHKNPENISPLSALRVNIQRIPPQDAAIFGRYTYTETDRQYLRPPFEFFALDLRCNFYASDKCLQGIPWNVQTCQ
jgi:hypothetical protein